MTLASAPWSRFTDGQSRSLSLEGLAILAAVHGLALPVGPTLGTPALAALVTVGPRVPGVAEQWERTGGRLGDGPTQWLLILATSLLVIGLCSRDRASRRSASDAQGCCAKSPKDGGAADEQV